MTLTLPNFVLNMALLSFIAIGVFFFYSEYRFLIATKKTFSSGETKES